jgi:hypothetical protein
MKNPQNHYGVNGNLPGFFHYRCYQLPQLLFKRKGRKDGAKFTKGRTK